MTVTAALCCRMIGRNCRRSLAYLIVMSFAIAVIFLSVYQQTLPLRTEEPVLVTAAAFEKPVRHIREEAEPKFNYPDKEDGVIGFLPIGPDGIVIREDMSAEMIEDALFHYMMMPTYSCKEIHRLGTHGDGGYEICIDKEYYPSRLQCLAYSFGIKNNWRFDEDLSKYYNCEIHSFDPSINQSDHRHSYKVWFHNLGVAGDDFYQESSGWTMRTVGTIKKRLNQTARTLDVLKLDVEGAEWDVIPQMLKSGVLNDVRQFCFELHLLAEHRRHKEGLVAAYNLLKSLYDAGFRLFYTHLNRGSAYISPLTKRNRHSCLEFHYVNTRTTSPPASV